MALGEPQTYMDGYRDAVRDMGARAVKGWSTPEEMRGEYYNPVEVENVLVGCPFCKGEVKITGRLYFDRNTTFSCHTCGKEFLISISWRAGAARPKEQT